MWYLLDRHAVANGSTVPNATKSRKVTRYNSVSIWKDAKEFDESDEYCPHCDNHFVLDAKTPKPALNIEGEDARVDSRMLKDDRIQGEEERSIFNVKDASDRLG
ncbi:MAG: Proteasome subunit alpha type-4 [Chaenotheca gracillima]|nr:MAG: Proteasome subunit alpha type-4 [Chaenotheca gracillima]